MKRVIFSLAILSVFCCSAQAQNKVILSAMKDELARSMQELKLENEAGPYYISYRVRDTHSLRIAADSGAITVNSDGRSRSLNVDLRVGSYAQDNSNFVSLSNLSNMAGTSLTGSALSIDDDYDVLRRQIWQATDRAYKSALETLTKKKAALQNTVQTESLPDFTKGQATFSSEAENSLLIQKQPWTQLVNQLSKHFLGEHKIQKSKVDLSVMIGNTYSINSEGATVIEPHSTTQLSIAAATQAEDGMPINNFRIYTAARPEDLPEKARLEADINALISELLKAQSAPLGGEYSGPVLFEGQAAGELFDQGIANLLSAKRQPVSDSPQVNAMLGRSLENPFQSKINMKVAANFLSMKAQPTLKNYNQKQLLGSCKVDDEAVPGQDVSLIENGILKNLLTSRTPVKGIAGSNGHARGGAAVPSVIQVISTNTKTHEQLKQQLIDAAKEEGLEFGYLVRGITPASNALGREDSDVLESVLLRQQSPPESSQFRLTKPYSIFRVSPDGKEEMVRGIEFGAISINFLKNVLATSDDEIVYEYPVNNSNLFSGSSVILSLLGTSAVLSQAGFTTVITPSLLIGGIDLRKSGGSYPKLPIVSYPTK
jgi:predicted Zn-dependent protease